MNQPSCSQERSEGSVSITVNQLDESARRLEDMVADLAKILDPIIQKNLPPVDADVSSGEQPDSCDIANRLRGIRDTLKQIESTLDALKDTIDL